MLHEKYLKESFNQNGELTKYEIIIPEWFNFGYHVVDELAAKNPDKTALVYTNDMGEEKIISFAEISEKSNQAASFFLKLGIKKNDRVIIILKRHYEFWYTIIALHKIGAIAIPATNQLLVKDLEYRFNAAGITTVISTPEGDISDNIDKAAEKYGKIKNKIMVRAKKDGWLSLEEGMEKAGKFERPDLEDLPKNDDIMLLYFTSGTTGMPKMVVHDYTYPLGHIMTAKYWHNIKPDDLHLTVSETGWAKSVWGKLYGQWLMESAVFVYDMDRFNAKSLLKMMDKYKVTTFCAPPTIYRFLLQEDFGKYDLSSLRYATTAGEALNSEVYKKFYNLTGLKIMEAFGQTETTVLLGTFNWMEPKPGSMGKPSKAYDIVLVDTENKPVKTGETGEICIRTSDKKIAGIFLGYYNDEEKTKSVWYDGLYHTGDLAWMDEDGYYWYVSRADDIIKSSGYRIGPFEVESVIMEHPAVVECAVTGVPDPVRGQTVKATIVLASGYSPSEKLKNEIQQYVKENTAPYKYPRVIEFVTELPKTISGKIRRVEIRGEN